MDAHCHIVDEAARRSRNEVVAGTTAELATILLRHATEREELDKKQSQDFTDMYSKVSDKWQKITEQYHRTSSQVHIRMDEMRRRHKVELENAHREDGAAGPAADRNPTVDEIFRRAQALHEETEAGRPGKPAQASRSTFQGSDGKTRKPPKSRMQAKMEESQILLTRIVSRTSSDATSPLDVMWYGRQTSMSVVLVFDPRMEKVDTGYCIDKSHRIKPLASLPALTAVVLIAFNA